MPRPEPKYGGVKFEEALAALKKRAGNQIPTERWDEWVGETHANAFTVAGATQEGLLNDLQKAVTETIDTGGTLNDFRKQFDEIVDRTGWNYKGGRGWRTRVIYQTNARTSYAAGRWEQAQRAMKREAKRGRTAYLMYITMDDGRVREQHRQWHYIIRPVDDPFWETHYPPNGWGCRCIVRIVTERYLKARGLKPTSDADLPEWRTEDRINPKTGQIYPDQVPGIDSGWNYNVGKAYLMGSAETYGQRIMRAAPEFRPGLLAYADQFLKSAEKSFKNFAVQTLATVKQKGTFNDGAIQPIGFLPDAVIDHLNNAAPSSALITISDKELAHAMRTFKVVGDRALDYRDALHLMGITSSPDAVLYDTELNNLIFVQRTSKGWAKVVVETTRRAKDGRIRNWVRTAGIVSAENLQEKKYKLLDGEL